MLGVIVGSFLTLLLLGIGFVLGYLVGDRTIDRKVEEFKQKVIEKPKNQSGPVKILDPEQRKFEDNKEFRNKVKDLLQ